MRLAALATGALALGCGGQSGTLDVELIAAPGSPVIAQIQHLRLTLTAPRRVIEADRGPGGFTLAIEVDADGTPGSLIVEGFAADGSLIATGQSPPFAVAALTARVVIYVAAPNSIGLAPARARSVANPGATALSYGFAIAGGAANGIATDAIAIYNAYDHTLLDGAPLPAPRIAPILATASRDTIYVIGGNDSSGAPQGTVWRFDTNAPAPGTYSEIINAPEFARAGGSAVALAPEHHLISGAPPVELLFGQPRSASAPELGPSGAAAIVNDVHYALFSGNPIRRARGSGSEIDMVAAASAPGAVAFTLAGTTVGFAGGDLDIVAIEADTGDAVRRSGAVLQLRIDPAIAATDRFLVIAGGRDAAATELATAEVLDAATLEHIVTVPCIARSGHRAFALPNGQIALVGGLRDHDEIELFTPPPP